MPPGRSRSSLSSIRLSQPMPMIIEGIADTPRPHVPPKSPRRLSVDPPSVSTSNRSSLRSPTPLAAIPGGPKSEATPEALQNDKTHPVSPHPGIYGAPLTLRKGWYRTIIACFLLVGLIIGLSVGLTIGLRKRYILLLPITFFSPPTKTSPIYLGHPNQNLPTPQIRTSSSRLGPTHSPPR